MERLGARNLTEIMNHPLFNDFDWNSYEKKTLPSPLKTLIDKNPMHTESGLNLDEIIPDDESIKLSKTLPFTFVEQSKDIFSVGNCEDN